VVKFAASGKKTAKKDLGAIAMTYGYVYVANVGMGANKQPLIKAVTEAESYDGPSLIMCYAHCINQGINSGISISHPIGRTGAGMVLTLMDEMLRKEHALGLAALCIGGGHGMAAVLKKV